MKSSYNNNKLKIYAPTWNNNLNYKMNLIPYQIYKIILSIFKKNMAKVKAGNDSESLLNEIRQIVYCLYQWKQITKKVFNSTVDTIFMNSENRKTPKPHVFILKFTHKLELRIRKKVIAL